MKKTSIFKLGIFAIVAFGLAGCSQNQASAPSIHKDLLDAGSKFVKLEYSIATSPVVVDPSQLDEPANAVSDLYVNYAQIGNGLNKTESEFVDDVVNSRGMYENLMSVRAIQITPNMTSQEKKDTLNLKKKTEKDFQDYFVRMKQDYNIQI